ncbi:hypothetical protein PLESTB_000998600 [Pleodorina starrii]|uniref:DAGKc domain-containing protein n=1 Tax=Pleodorina starrii TaxID=330485 RepID=A0A9W6BNK2_9CHLO|nr:hypothetical protein PLESTM_001857600 [Pleodorina starrii]GLC55541.1 hypothetical protein PLESTB_000998600 [Pleodorina starrii]GLC76422.1 hypothetical protein PLESTF_001778900 [Pleodorina starrii]
MDGVQIDPERAQGLRTLAVRCGGVTGTISLADGGVFFTPDPIRGGGLFGWFTSLLRPVRPQFIPAGQLLGARLESPCAFSVWYAPEYTARMGCVTKRLYHARHTPRYEVSDPHAAAELVAAIRRSASWWGRDKPPHVAAIVNPKAGRGGAVRLLRNQLLPLLRDVAGLRVTEHPTQAPGHASMLVRELALNVPGGGGATVDGVDLIMFVGGDGTLHEGLQGLFQRPDWAAAREVPLVAVPCGSGNGVAASCGLWDLTTAAVAVCRGRVAPVDVASVLQPPNSRYYCLLSVVYGAMANLDIGTNHLRWMGELRFHLGGLREIMRGRCYSCRVFVLPPSEAAPASASAAAGGGALRPAPAEVALEGPDGAAQRRAGSAAGGPRAGDDDVLVSGMREPLLREGAAASSGESAAADAAGGARGDGGGNDHDAEGSLLSQYPPGPPLPLLSQLPRLPARLPDSPSALPRGWQQLADSFAIFGAYNTQYLALGARANPGGLMGDGAWEVWQLEAQSRRAGAGLRLRCLKVLLGVEDGSFARTPGVMHVTKARALLFEQRDSSTWTVLDGEAVEERPLYLEVHPGLCRLLVAPGFREEPL